MTTNPSPTSFFLGPLDSHASVGGLTWFCHRVWPELTRRLPAARFAIAGWNSADRVQDLSLLPGVIVASNIIDASTYIQEATIAVFPYRLETHAARDDVLHALAMRKAVLATPVVLEGLAVQSGVDLRVAHTTSDWIAVTYHLMMHPEVCAELGAAGRAYVENNHPRQLKFQPSEVLSPAAEQIPIGPQPKFVQRHPTVQSKPDKQV
jgi:polysaccharide biosynthesis protein PslH